jgi:hypothetical protein
MKVVYNCSDNTIEYRTQHIYCSSSFILSLNNLHNIVNRASLSLGSLFGNIVGFLLTSAIWPIILIKLSK